MFGKDNTQISSMAFKSRADAFAYILNYLVNDKKVDPLEAAKKADEFAEVFASNMGLPAKTEPELTGIDKYLAYASKIETYAKEHPKLVEYAIPAATFIVGLFTGKQADSQPAPEPYQSIRTPPNQEASPKSKEQPEEPIDFTKID